MLLLFVSLASATEWEAMAPMPKELSDMSATVVGSTSILVVGGCDSAQLSCDSDEGCTYCPSVSSATLEYSSVDDRWRWLADHPRQRYRHAAAYASDNRLYVGGGRDLNDDVVDVVDVYDVAMNEWTALDAAVAVPRSDLAAFAFEGSVVFYGGYGPNYVALASGIFVVKGGGFLTDDDSAVLPDLVSPRGDFAIVVAGRIAHAIGGWSHADWCNPLDSVEWMDLDEAEWRWRETASLAVARGDKAAAAVGDVVHVVGGEHNNNCTTASEPVDDVEALRGGLRDDPRDVFWDAIGEIPEARFRGAAAAIDRDLFFFGGQSPQQSENCPASAAFCFPVTNHTWRLNLGLEEEEEPHPQSGGGTSKKKKSSKGSRPSGVGFFFIGAAVGVAVAAFSAAVFVFCSASYATPPLFKPTTVAAGDEVVAKPDDGPESKIEMSAV